MTTAFPFFFFALAMTVLAPTMTVRAFGLPKPSTPSTTTAFVGGTRSSFATSPLFASTAGSKPVPKPRKKGYIPKWKKKKTLAEETGVIGLDGGVASFAKVGIKGDVPVVFKQGNETKMILASVGDPLREVAIQAGQFIKYGCGKGECGTCEALVDGKWIRPCMATVPADCMAGQEYVVQVKEVKNKAKSSGKFYSFWSIIMGFWNNLLGMFGMVKYRRAANKNWEERREYEDSIKQKTLEKKRARALLAKQQQEGKP